MAEETKTLQTLLAGKTGKSDEEVLQFLQDLKQKIEDAVETGESFTIEGFGTFSGESGSLHFEPSGRLETEINQKYAGMQPIELVEAFKETGAGEPLESIEPKSLKLQELLSESVAGSAETETGEEETGNDSFSEEKEEQSKPVESDQKDLEKEPAGASINKKHPLPSRRKNRGGVWIAAAAVLIVVILVIGWLFFSNRIFPEKGSSNITASQPVDTAKVADLSVNQENDSTKVQSSQASETAKDANKEAVLADSSTVTYGLHGMVNPQFEKAYTIVIHSFRQKTTVQGIAKKLRKKGYRAVIFSGKSGSDIRWRVGLGQFKTIEAAQEAVKKLPERYQKAHFIHRINH